MKRLFCVIGCVVTIGAVAACGGSSAGGDAANPTKGVVYKAAPADVNARAEAFVRELLLGAESAGRLENDPPVLVGAFLWAQVKDHPDVAGIETGKMYMMIPTAEGTVRLEGRMLQDADEVRRFWTAFFAKVPVAPFTLRRLRADEREIYWAMISWDIEEPIFIVEGQGHKLVIDVAVHDDGSFDVFWIDDIAAIGVRAM
jgi:hypothetical protein